MEIFIIIIMIIVRGSYQSLMYEPVDTSKKDVMLEKLSEILSDCDYDELNHAGLVWYSEIPERWTRTFMKNIPTIRLKVPISNPNESFYPRSIYYNSLFRYDKLHLFILFSSSPSNFTGLIKRLRDSIWWNPLAFYVIVDTAVDTCSQPEAYLSIAWKLDLETSVFTCVDLDGRHIVYTYNRHGNPSPGVWYGVSSSIDGMNRTWGMLKHKLEDDTTCEELYFSKGIKVGGYTVRLVGVIAPPSLSYEPEEKDMFKYDGLNGIILRNLFSKMNATTSVKMLDENIRIHQLLQNMSDGQYDMLMNAQYIYDKPNYTMTYPHLDSGISVLTRIRGFDSNETKILKFMNPRLILCILVISVVTVFVLGILAGLGFGSACLEVSRITINSSVLHIPQGTPLRIYLITVILLFFITGSLFQSNLSSILTSSIPKPDIDDGEALKEAGYLIYTFRNYKVMILDLTLQSRVKETDMRDCSCYVIEHPDTACVADRSRLTKVAFEKDLHVSKHRITSLYVGYVTRHNFPLVHRIGRMLMSMSQGGLIIYWSERTVAIYKNKWMMKAQEMKKKKYRMMRLSDLYFAFYVLLFGLGISVVTFLTELWIARARKSRNGRRRTGRRILCC